MLEAALVTGAARRVGRAVAVRLAGEGWAVAVHYRRSREAAEATVAAIREAGGAAEAVQADLREEDALAALVDETADRLGPVTVLVNNASVFDKDDAETATRESWDRHLETNLRAPFVLSQEMARALPAERAGAIVNMIDHRVWKLNPLFLSYTLSKAGLWTLTRTLAQAFAPRIRVNAIGPGPTFPNQHQVDATFERERAALPLQRGPEPEEIANAVRFILESPSLTGQMIALDGGQHLAWQTPDVFAGAGE